MEFAGPALAIIGLLTLAFAQYRIGATREWRNVADAREAKIEAMEEKINDLQNKVSHIEGQYDALQSMKIDQIAEATAARVIDQLQVQGEARSA